MINRSRILRRYTDIPSLIDILYNKKLTLVDPRSWDDKNDSYYMSVYKERKKLKSLTATCFTSAAETYHHWKIFAGNISGVCIVFLTEPLIQKSALIEDVRSDFVEYKTLRELNDTPLNLDQLPFLKRYPFRDEKEFRIIYESKTMSNDTYNLDIEISDVDRIFLSPWIHPSLVDGIKNLIKSIPDCGSLKITRSTLIGNENWKKHAHYNIE